MSFGGGSKEMRGEEEDGGMREERKKLGFIPSRPMFSKWRYFGLRSSVSHQNIDPGYG